MSDVALSQYAWAIHVQVYQERGIEVYDPPELVSETRWSIETNRPITETEMFFILWRQSQE